MANNTLVNSLIQNAVQNNRIKIQEFANFFV